MLIRSLGCDTASGGPLEEALEEKERFVCVLHGLRLFPDRNGECREPDRPPSELPEDRIEDGAVDFVESEIVDFVAKASALETSRSVDVVGPPEPIR